MTLKILSLLKTDLAPIRILSTGYVGLSLWTMGTLGMAHAQTQITSDTTLPNNSTVSNAGAITQINGGTRIGNSLFHSFTQFSVFENETASFNNTVDIDNIFSRVTGTSPSEINGTIQSAGVANLFLLNPNGVVFGERSKLDVDGSFLVSTADYIKFDNLRFSATNTDFQPLLNISQPRGLGFTNKSADIINRSLNGLQVPDGETIALVGGNVRLTGGSLSAENGHVDLGSIAGPGFVSISSDNGMIALSYSNDLTFQDIALSEQAMINASGNGSGSIHIQGREISLSGDSLVFVSTSGTADGNGISLNATDSVDLRGDVTGIFTEAFDLGVAGDISIETKRLIVREGAFIGSQADSTLLTRPGSVRIRATELVELMGTTSDFSFPSSISISVFGEATGQDKNLSIETAQLMLKEGAQIFTETFGTGQGANFTVNATEVVTLSGSIDGENGFPAGLFARSNPDATGNAGALTINAQHFIAENGAQVSTDTQGSGSAGVLLINAAQSIALLNTSQDGILPSGVFALGASGNGGDLRLETNQLEILGGAQVSTSARGVGQGGTLIINAVDSIIISGISSLGDSKSNSNILVSAEPGATGNAGELRVRTGTLTVENEGRISADNFGTGNGSTATINARQMIIRDGGRVGAGSLKDPDPNSVNTTDPSQLGPGGTLTINASEKVEVSGINSQLFTRAEGAGPAGDLIINETSDSNLVVIVRDGAEINASSASSTGGNIIFNNPDAVLLRTGGRITAEAGLSQGAGDGGNIILTMPDGFLVSVADEDSDIVANAFAGNGGNINITAQGIFNLVERPAIQGNGTNDIDASSRFGQSGTVVINNFNLDPTQNLIELPTDTTAPTVAQRCLADSQGQSAFVVTGQGGTTPTPREIVRNESAGLIDLGSNSSDSNDSNDTIVGQSNHPNTTSISVYNRSVSSVAADASLVEAQGWQRDTKGNVVLIAQAPNSFPAHPYASLCPSF